MFVLMLKTGRVDDREDQPIAVSGDRAYLEKYMEEEEIKLKACIQEWRSEEYTGSWTRHRKSHGITYSVPCEAVNYFKYHIEEAIHQTTEKKDPTTAPEYCPSSIDHVHQLNWSTVIPGMKGIIDVDCAYCGRRASIKVNLAEIQW